MPLSNPQIDQPQKLPASVHFIGPTKPILKPSPAQSPAHTPARLASPSLDGPAGKRAHFPPPGQEPTARYHGVDYDRTPIVVLPNVCALPERGCPGKTYFQDDRAFHFHSNSSTSGSGSGVAPGAGGNHAHPTKFMKYHHPSPRPLSSAPGSILPPLTHSDTASSDDCEFSDSDEPHMHMHMHMHMHANTNTNTNTDTDTDMHAHSHPHPLYRVVFPPTDPVSVFSTESEPDHARQPSGSTVCTLSPTTPSPYRRKPIGVGTQRDVWGAISESSEDDCLGGF